MKKFLFSVFALVTSLSFAQSYTFPISNYANGYELTYAGVYYYPSQNEAQCQGCTRTTCTNSSNSSCCTTCNYQNANAANPAPCCSCALGAPSTANGVTTYQTQWVTLENGASITLTYSAVNSSYNTESTANFQFSVNSGNLIGEIVSSGSGSGFSLNGNSTYGSSVSPTTSTVSSSAGFQINYSSSN